MEQRVGKWVRPEESHRTCTVPAKEGDLKRDDKGDGLTTGGIKVNQESN